MPCDQVTDPRFIQYRQCRCRRWIRIKELKKGFKVCHVCYAARMAGGPGRPRKKVA